MPRHPPNALKSLDRSHYQDSGIRYQMSRKTPKTRFPCPMPASVLGRTKGNTGQPDGKTYIVHSFCPNMARSSTTARGSRAVQTNPSFTMSISSTHAFAAAKLVSIGRSGKPGPCKLAGNGGARRDRTDDLKLAKLPLSQLSYGPGVRCQSSDVSHQAKNHLDP